MLFVGTSIIHPSTEGVFLLCNILDLLIYSLQKEKDLQAADRSGTADGFIHSQPEPQPSGAGRSDRKKTAFCIHRRKKSKRHSDCIRF